MIRRRTSLTWSVAAWPVPALPAAVLLGMVASAAPGAAQTLLTQDEALVMAFSSADSIARRTAYLTEGEVERTQAAAGQDTEAPSGVVTYYVGYGGGAPVGVAYFDAHRVRTLPETVMIVVGTDDRIRRIEVLSFYEPPEYRAPDAWIEQLEGRTLGPSLSLRGEVVNITGATLTSGAITRAARRVLALHEIIRPLKPDR